MEFKSDHYYGNEANQYIFYRIPKMLFTEPYFCKMSNDSKILYGLMLDRMSISVKNNWRDENNRIFIYFNVSSTKIYSLCACFKIFFLMLIKIIISLYTINGWNIRFFKTYYFFEILQNFKNPGITMFSRRTHVILFWKIYKNTWTVVTQKGLNLPIN